MVNSWHFQTENVPKSLKHRKNILNNVSTQFPVVLFETSYFCMGTKTVVEYRTDPNLVKQINDLKKQISTLTTELIDEKNKRINGLNDALREKDEALKKLQNEMNKKLDEVNKQNQRNQKELKDELSKLRQEYANTMKEMTVQDLLNSLQNLIQIRDEIQTAYINNLQQLYRNQIIYNQLSCNIKYEENKLVKFKNEINDTNIMQLLLYSPTDDGKSTLANRLFGDTSQQGNEGPFKTSHFSSSETQNIQKGYIKFLWDIPISVIDTPGFYDSNGKFKDRVHNNNIIEYLRGCNGINAFILLKQCGIAARLDNTYIQMLRLLHKQISNKADEFWKHVIIILPNVDGNNKRYNKCGDLYKQDLMDNIRKQLVIPIDIDLPIISISTFDDYKKPLYRLINEIVPRNKFYSTMLHSPLQQLKTDALGIKFELNNFTNINVHIVERISSVMLAIDDTANKLQENNVKHGYNSNNKDWKVNLTVNDIFDENQIKDFIIKN